MPVEPFAGRRCLVTGGLGFIGSNLALALADGGAAVTVVDARVERHGANPANLVPDGQVSHVDSMDDPLFDLDVNTTGQFRFLELLRRENPSATVVYTSTRQIF